MAPHDSRRGRGFTLIEMIVSVAVLAMVSIYLTDMLIRQNRAYTVVDQVTEAQQNLRAIGDLLERELRATGFMVGEAGGFCGVDNIGAADIVFVSDADAINPANQTRLDLSADVTNFPAANLTLNVPGTGQGTVIDGTAFYDNNNDGVAESDFQANAALGQFGGVIVYDRNNPENGTSCGVVTSVNSPTSITVDWNVTVGPAVLTQLNPAPVMIPSGPGTDLAVIPANWYAIVPPNATGTAAPQLWRNGILLADDVEDLQFAAFYDLNDDDQVQVGEWAGSAGAGEPQYRSDGWGNTAVNGGDNTMLRELRVNFVVRTRNPDPDILQNANAAQGIFQTMENRAAPGGGPDGFRRRVHTLSVQPRNLGRRPLGV